METRQMREDISWILAVDDEDFTLELYRDVLEDRTETYGNTKRTFRLVTANSATEGLETFKRHLNQKEAFGVVFLDVNMPPGPDGIWLAKEIRALDEEVNIVLVTGFAGIDLEAISAEIPPLDKLLYLQKPFHVQEILQLASALTAKWHAEKKSKEVMRFLEMEVEARTGELLKEIEERKWAQQRLEASEKNFSNIIRHSRDPILIISKEGKVKYLNPAGLEILGDPTKVSRELTQLALNPTSLTSPVEVDIKTQNGAMSAEMVVSQTQWEGEESFLASFRDITSRKRLEEVLKESLQKVRETLVETIKAMAYLVETRDPYTAGHQQRVALLADEIAKVLNLPEDQRYGLYLAALIHDIGKISIPAEILTKPSKLTDIEMKLMQGHPQTGYDILKNIPFPWPIATIVLEHHERLDGSGYPLGKSDGEILLESQILAVADVVEAMASHRPYRPALGVEPALLEIDSKKGVKYNPQVVEACIEVVREGRVKIG